MSFSIERFKFSSFSIEVGRAKGDGPKVTEPNLRFPARKSAVSCEKLRLSAVSCAGGPHMLEFPGGGANLRKSAVFCEICVLGSICHLSSFPIESFILA